MTEAITSQEAREIELPRVWHPVQRLGRLAELGAGFHLKKMAGSGPLPLYMTRGDLVRTAEAHERAVQMMDMLQQIEDRGGE